MSKKLVDVETELRHETEKAYLVYDGREENFEGEMKEIQAIKSNSGNSYDKEGRITTNPDKIVEAAKKFEGYLKETE